MSFYINCCVNLRFINKAIVISVFLFIYFHINCLEQSFLSSFIRH